MYLLKLYKHQKQNFILVILFLSFSLIINYKSGMIATPINLYGMFSGGYSINDTLSVNKIVIDGQPLNYSKYSYEKRDLMIGILDKYLLEKQNNSDIFETFKKLSLKVNSSINISSTTFNNQINKDVFMKWYGELLTRICKKNISQFEIYNQKYIWKENALVSVDSVVQIMSYVP